MHEVWTHLKLLKLFLYFFKAFIRKLYPIGQILSASGMYPYLLINIIYSYFES
jgi:hypothetical protein